MSEWSRLKKWDRSLMAVVETTRDGYLVSIRTDNSGLVGSILAIDEGRTVDVAFARAMSAAEHELAIMAEVEAATPGRRKRRSR